MTQPRRSQNWYGTLDKGDFILRSWMKRPGLPDHAVDGRPIIGLCKTRSELTPCDSGFRALAEAVKRGVCEAEGFPVEFPVTSLGETQMKPTAKLFCNLLAMDVEDRIRAYRIDGVVLLSGDISADANRAEIFNEEVIRPLSNPVKPAAGLRVLRGNLASVEAIAKPSAATDALLEHEGPTDVFESIEDMKAEIDRDGLRDMIRVSGARMSGTAFGNVVLHVAPEAQAGGPLALVQTDDRIRVSASRGALTLAVEDAELATRRAAWQPDPPRYTRGYAKLYVDHVLPADRGADLDFLVGKDTRLVTRESH